MKKLYWIGAVVLILAVSLFAVASYLGEPLSPSAQKAFMKKNP